MFFYEGRWKPGQMMVALRTSDASRYLVISLKAPCHYVTRKRMKMDMSELRPQESIQRMRALLARLFSLLGHQYHGLQNVQSVVERLTLLDKRNLLLHRGPDHFEEPWKKSGSVRTQNTTEKTHSKWGKHFQFEQRRGKMRAFCRLFMVEVGRTSMCHHAVS
jgi:hypothetical protein